MEEGERAPYLEERVEKLERQVASRAFDPYLRDLAETKIDIRLKHLECAVYNCTDDALKEPITAKDVDRWRAIEKAADDVLFTWTKHGLGTKETGSMAIAALQDAVQK